MDNSSHQDKLRKRRGTGCLTVFGLMFLLPGLIIGLLALKNVSASLTALNWEPVQAKVLSTSLKTSRGSDSTTYKAQGTYSYEWNGKRYQSDTLFFGSGSDNIGTYHQDIVNTLRNHKNRQHTIQAWVNPDDPAQAVIYRDVRWGMFFFMMLFFALFAGVGAGMVYWARHSKKVIAIENGLQSLYPEQPWKWREEWQSTTLASKNKNLLWFSIGFAIFWNLISLPLWFVLPDEIFEKKNHLAAIGYLFPLVGIGLAAWAIRNYRQWKRFGESEFSLQEMPVRLGSTLRGELLIPGDIPPGSQCLIKLECIHSYQQGSGEDSKTVEDILWQDEQRLNVSTSLSVTGHALPIVFKLPATQPISDWMNGNNQHLWRLSVQSDIPGADYAAQFELPVFEALESVSDAEAEYEEQFFADLNNDDAIIDQGDWSRLDFTLDQTVQGTHYTFDRARLKGMCLVLTFMTLIFGGVGILMFVIENGSIFIGVGFSLFAFLLAWGALHQWLYKSEITVSHSKLVSRSGWFNSTIKEFRLQDIKRIYKHSSMSSGNIKYYGIYIDTPDKSKIKLAENLVGNRDVDSLIEKISNEFGLNKP